MRCIISGSRTITNYEFFESIISKCPFKGEITTVLSGNCTGIDRLGEQWAKNNNIPIEMYPANWDLYGKAAGPIRNGIMASRADAAIIIHKIEADGSVSKGTQSMKELAYEHELKVYYVPVRPKETFSLEQLKELQVQLEGKGMVGGDLARRLIKQQITQLQEYQKVVRDTRLMWEALKDIDFWYMNDGALVEVTVDEDLVHKALETPTAKLLEELCNNDQSISKKKNSYS